MDQIVTDYNFYQDPVVLEPTGDEKTLGCALDIPNIKISVILPSEDWQFLHKDCATPVQQMIAVFQRRAFLIRRQSFPECNKKQQLSDLAAIYQHRLLPMKHCTSMSTCPPLRCNLFTDESFCLLHCFTAVPGWSACFFARSNCHWSLRLSLLQKCQ